VAGDTRCNGSYITLLDEFDDGLNPAQCGGYVCQMPSAEGVTYAKANPSCDPFAGPCSMSASVPVHFFGNSQNYPDDSQGAYATLILYNSAGVSLETCGYPFASINSDLLTAQIDVSVSCSSPNDSRFDLQVIACHYFGCRNVIKVPIDFKAAAGCSLPPMYACSSGDSGGACCIGPGGSVTPVGAPTVSKADSDLEPESVPTVKAPGPALSLPGSGPPGFEIRYLLGGAGWPGLPESGAFGRPLGSGWSHTFAQRIVRAPDETKVWLIAPDGSYRLFQNPDAGGLYQVATPGDEKRELEWLGAGVGWVLHEHDGTDTYFRADGLWDETVDPHSLLPPIQSTYNASLQLTGVCFPDGRSLTLTYGAGGRLSSVKENPVPGSGATARTWSVDWVFGVSAPFTIAGGPEMLIRPDGSRYRFAYDSSFDARLTRVYFEGPGGTPSRVFAAWSYDSQGRVFRRVARRGELRDVDRPREVHLELHRRFDRSGIRRLRRGHHLHVRARGGERQAAHSHGIRYLSRLHGSSGQRFRGL
jgi:hypothetical protein